MHHLDGDGVDPRRAVEARSGPRRERDADRAEPLAVLIEQVAHALLRRRVAAADVAEPALDLGDVVLEEDAELDEALRERVEAPGRADAFEALEDVGGRGRFGGEGGGHRHAPERGRNSTRRERGWRFASRLPVYFGGSSSVAQQG